MSTPPPPPPTTFKFNGNDIDVSKFIFVPDSNLYLDIDKMLAYKVDDKNVLTRIEITEPEETRQNRIKKFNNQVERENNYDEDNNGGARRKSSRRKSHKKKTRRHRRKSVRRNRRR
jgi:hypothetical protein